MPLNSWATTPIFEYLIYCDLVFIDLIKPGVNQGLINLVINGKQPQYKSSKVQTKYFTLSFRSPDHAHIQFTSDRLEENFIFSGVWLFNVILILFDDINI